jgi:hypothetical protein
MEQKKMAMAKLAVVRESGNNKLNGASGLYGFTVTSQGHISI